MKLTFEKNCRGFRIARFQDANGDDASIQESSAIADPEALVWLGQQHTKCKDCGCEMPSRMHLTQSMAAALIPALQHFVETGDLPKEGQ